MSRFDVIRAWKDASYRESLSAEEQASLPEHPAGSLELYDAELGLIVGGEAELVAVNTGRWYCNEYSFFSACDFCATNNVPFSSCGHC